jgi:hypothetical protein
LLIPGEQQRELRLGLLELALTRLERLARGVDGAEPTQLFDTDLAERPAKAKTRWWASMKRRW